MLRLIVAVCYGAAIGLTVLTLVGVTMLDRGHWAVVAGWGFCVAPLFAVGRLADLARDD